MTFNTVAIILGIFLIAGYQVYVSWRMSRSTAYSKRQKSLQVAMIWLIPIVGAAIVHWFASNGLQPYPQPDKNHIRQELTPPGVTTVKW